MNINKYYTFFENYTNNYLNNALNESERIHLNRKKEHSLRVVNNALEISKDLNLSDGNADILTIIALFHDLGRFQQFKKYHTYDDTISENHALLSVKIINDTKILSELDDNTKNLIKKCIFIHNMQDIPNNVTEDEFLFSSILRDADKLDFYKNMLDIIPNLSQEEQKIFYANKDDIPIISEDVYNKILNKNTISNIHIKTKLDKQARSLGFITSDLNYNKSFEIILNNNYIDRIYDLLPKTEQVTSIYNFVRQYAVNHITNLK